eukprot:141158-Rhodomonas_salina.1
MEEELTPVAKLWDELQRYHQHWKNIANDVNPERDFECRAERSSGKLFRVGHVRQHVRVVKRNLPFSCKYDGIYPKCSEPAKESSATQLPAGCALISLEEVLALGVTKQQRLCRGHENHNKSPESDSLHSDIIIRLGRDGSLLKHIEVCNEARKQCSPNSK